MPRARRPRELDEVDLGALLRGVLRYRPTIAFLALLGAAGGVALSLTEPNQFTSEGKIMVRLGMRERRMPEVAIDASLEGTGPASGIADELELLRNPVVFERVARIVGPADLLRPYDPTLWDSASTPLHLRLLHRAQAWIQAHLAGTLPPSDSEHALLEAAAVVENSLLVLDVRGSNILRVFATTHTPDLAKGIVDAFLEVAEAWHREIYDPREQLSFVSDRQTELQERLESTQRLLREHQEQCGFLDNASSQSTLVERIGSLEESLREQEIRASTLGSQLEILDAELARLPEMVEELVPSPPLRNQTHVQLLAELQAARAERTALERQFQPGARIFQQRAEPIDQNIAELSARLEASSEYLPQAAPLQIQRPNPRLTELADKREELHWEQSGLAEALKARQQDLEVLRTTLRQALECAPLHAELEQSVLLARKEAQDVGAALRVEQTLARLDEQQQLGSLRVVQPGRLPSGKSGPNRKRYVFMGLFVGIAVGIGQALLRRTLDSTIRDPQPLEDALGLPLLAIVPESRGLRRTLRRRWTEGSAT